MKNFLELFGNEQLLVGNTHHKIALLTIEWEKRNTKFEPELLLTDFEGFVRSGNEFVNTKVGRRLWFYMNGYRVEKAPDASEYIDLPVPKTLDEFITQTNNCGMLSFELTETKQ